MKRNNTRYYKKQPRFIVICTTFGFDVDKTYTTSDNHNPSIKISNGKYTEPVYGEAKEAK